MKLIKPLDDFEKTIEQAFKPLQRLKRFFEDWDIELPSESVNLPKIDVWEDTDKYVVEAELPGFDKKDIDVNITDDILTIKASRKQEQEKKDKNYYYAERSYGEFVRSLRLPSEVDKKGVKAKYNNGVLELTLPKTKEAKEKTTKVEIE
ncbi:MAG: Hsp20/alpha crystallin family protein [Endomicrobia bacterium]|nr:Hsp20/alpha crystallin family protein [Endomicrobiia bacterium]MCX7956673.1 Hsp20/alpha crystallin family protein [Endomicrobiia bacterium]